jgi:hypothetical protein
MLVFRSPAMPAGATADSPPPVLPVSFSAQAMAEIACQHFTGWLYSKHADGIIAAATRRNDLLDPDGTTPHAQVLAGLQANWLKHGLVRINLDNPVACFFASIDNNGRGLCAKAAAVHLLVPVAVALRDTASPVGAVHVAVRHIRSKTTEYMLVQREVMRRLAERINSLHPYAVTMATRGSIAAVEAATPATKRSFTALLQDDRATERLLTRHPRAAVALLAAYDAIALYHQIGGNTGTYKDPIAYKVVLEAINRTIVSIIDVV